MTPTEKSVKTISVTTFFVLASVSIGLLTAAVAAEPTYRSKYIGQEKREIKSLSDEDIAELRSGAGWGLAKAAELNGLPGPKHILEMKEEIGLTAGQEEKVVAVYRKMNEDAVRLGNILIGYERELNDRFAARNIDEKILDELLGKISETYRALRYAHLAAHLQTPAILTEDQISMYNRLRGYSADDPCANIPKGHDPVMWRRHNNCD